MRQELFLVAIPDKGEAIRAVQACLPDAEIKVDSEASAELLLQYQVIDGEMFVLPDKTSATGARLASQAGIRRLAGISVRSLLWGLRVRQCSTVAR